MREELMKRLEENDDFGDASVDEILRILIKQTSLTEVIACLDMISVNEGVRVAAFDWSGRIYPIGPKADFTIPAPSWKIDSEGIEQLIKEDEDSPVLVQINPEDDPLINEGDSFDETGK